jgi:hypothetical protein
MTAQLVDARHIVEGIPDATPAQHAAAWRVLAECDALDVAHYIFGGTA